MKPYSIFISYRRGETSPIALLMKYEIEKRLQFVRVYVDVAEMELGDKFPENLHSAINSSDAVIALIGKNWMPKSGDPSSSKSDWVEKELLAASENSLLDGKIEKRKIFPIFVDIPPNFHQFELSNSLKFIGNIHSEQIRHAEWPHSIGPLVERLAVKMGIQKRPDSESFPKPDRAKARTQPMTYEELLSILEYDDYEGWYLDNFGNSDVRYLVKTFQFSGFKQASAFMRLVMAHCKVVDHHPEWRNVFNYVTVSLTTWDAKRQVTIYDLNLALYMNKAADIIRQRID